MKALALAVVLASVLIPKGDGLDQQMVRSANVFLMALTPAQKSAAVLPWKDQTTWGYVPGVRRGVAWDEMGASQKEAATALLNQSLSAAGFQKVETIRSLEAVLRDLEGNNQARDSQKYWFAFYGDPTADHHWSWRYEGHHVSLTFTMVEGHLVASTPQFLGSNPAEVRSGALKGTRVLAKEQDLAFEFVRLLSPAQQKKLVTSEVAPADISTTNSRKFDMPAAKGLAFSELTAEQQKALRKLIEAHAEVQAKEEVARRVKSVAEKELSVAWMGPLAKGGRHYYRIQTSNVLIEFDNTQDDGNHIHTVWRDARTDFGGDPLREHYLHSHSHTKR